MTAFLFPGQGSQFAGMGSDLYDRFPEAKMLFDLADTLLGFSLTDAMFGRDGAGEDALRQTDVTQPALFVHSLVVAELLRARGLTPAATAGHSLGEYSALAAVGALDFDAGLRIVRLRGRLMAEAGERRPGAMAAVLGMDDDDVVTLCEDAAAAGDGVVQAANFNAPGQVVVSGDPEAVERAGALARERGVRRVVPLPVSGAFHSPLMGYARDGLAEALAGLTLRSPECPVYLNVTAAPTRDPEEIRRRLLEQLLAPVRWSGTLRRMQENGYDRFLEIGAGNVLTGLVRRTLGRDVDAAAVGTADEVEAIVR